MKKNYIYPTQLFLIVCSSLFILKCGKGEDPPPAPVYNEPTPPVEVTITASDFSTTLEENPTASAVIGSVQASVSNGSLSYAWVSQSVEGAMTINASTGEISVSTPNVFDFESNTVITGVVQITSGNVVEEITVTINITDVNEEVTSLTLWDGPVLSFTKSNGADPNNESNQDRITDHVWITRANDGQIFNIVSESTANSSSSPAGTAWAQGSFDDISTLTFTSFRDACPSGKPKNAVGIPMVVHLIQDDVYIELRFTSWATSKQGGFSYQRTTQ